MCGSRTDPSPAAVTRGGAVQPVPCSGSPGQRAVWGGHSPTVCFLLQRAPPHANRRVPASQTSAAPLAEGGEKKKRKEKKKGEGDGKKWNVGGWGEEKGRRKERKKKKKTEKREKRGKEKRSQAQPGRGRGGRYRPAADCPAPPYKGTLRDAGARERGRRRGRIREWQSCAREKWSEASRLGSVRDRGRLPRAPRPGGRHGTGSGWGGGTARPRCARRNGTGQGRKSD